MNSPPPPPPTSSTHYVIIIMPTQYIFFLTLCVADLAIVSILGIVIVGNWSTVQEEAKDVLGSGRYREADPIETLEQSLFALLVS